MDLVKVKNWCWGKWSSGTLSKRWQLLWMGTTQRSCISFPRSLCWSSCPAWIWMITTGVNNYLKALKIWVSERTNIRLVCVHCIAWIVLSAKHSQVSSLQFSRQIFSDSTVYEQLLQWQRCCKKIGWKDSKWLTDLGGPLGTSWAGFSLEVLRASYFSSSQGREGVSGSVITEASQAWNPKWLATSRFVAVKIR